MVASPAEGLSADLAPAATVFKVAKPSNVTVTVLPTAKKCVPTGGLEIDIIMPAKSRL